MKKIILLLGIISMTLFIGCESDWYPIYEDWLCTINVDGTDLEYIRNSYDHFLLSPDYDTIIEYTKHKFYIVSDNNLEYRTLLIDLSGAPGTINKPSLSIVNIVFLLRDGIYVYDFAEADTTKLHVTDETNITWRLSVSRDGTKICYSTISDTLSTIVVLNSDGSDRNIIYQVENDETSTSYISSLRFVSSNESLLFTMNSNDYAGVHRGIYSISINGGNLHPIVNNVWPLYLTLSSNEEYVVFIDDYDIQKVNVDGSNHVFLQEVGSLFFYPSISPNCEKILYEYDDYPYIMNTGGTDSYKLSDRRIGNIDPDYKMSYFINNTKVLLTLEKQIN